MNLRRSGVALAAALSALVLSSCSGGPQVGEGSGGEGTETLIFDLGLELTTLDPNQIFDVSASTVLAQVYEGLVTYDTGTGEIVPALAESWTANDDATEYTFTLLDGVEFTTGNELTSADVVFSFERLRNLAAGSSYLMEGIGVEAVDEQTVKVTSETPKPEMLAMLATEVFSVYDSTAIQEEGGVSDETASKADTAGAAFDQESFGTGPYKLESYEPNAEVTLVYNEDYRGDEPDFGKVIVRNSRNLQQQILNIQNGGSDVTISLSAPQVAKLDSSKVNIISQPLPQVIYFALTNSGGPTTNADFRKAVALGIDYEGIVELAGEGAVQGTGVIPPMLPGAIPEEDALERDVEAAKKALEASGVGDQQLAISYGSDYAVGGQDMGVFAQKIQSDLKEIGMNVVLEGAPTQVSRTANQEGKIQGALWPFPPDYVDASQFLIHSPGGLLAERIHWPADEAPDIVKLAEEAARQIDPDARAEAYETWARALRDTNRFIGIVAVPQALVTSKRVDNLNMTVAGTPKLAELTLAN